MGAVHGRSGRDRAGTRRYHQMGPPRSKPIGRAIPIFQASRDPPDNSFDAHQRRQVPWKMRELRIFRIRRVRHPEEGEVRA